MKKILLAITASLSIVILTFSAALISGCASAPAGSNVATLPISPTALKDVAETTVVGVMTVKPQYKPALQALSAGLGTLASTNGVTSASILALLNQYIPPAFAGSESPIIAVGSTDLTDLFNSYTSQQGATADFAPAAAAIKNGLDTALALYP